VRVVEKADVATIEPLLCSIEAATTIIGRGERFIIDAIARGVIQGVKSDRRTLVVLKSLRAYAESLPPAELKPDNREARRLRQSQKAASTNGKHRRAAR
jgi:hypothetical protein